MVHIIKNNLKLLEENIIEFNYGFSIIFFFFFEVLKLFWIFILVYFLIINCFSIRRFHIQFLHLNLLYLRILFIIKLNIFFVFSKSFLPIVISFYIFTLNFNVINLLIIFSVSLQLFRTNILLLILLLHTINKKS